MKENLGETFKDKVDIYNYPKKIKRQLEKLNELDAHNSKLILDFYRTYCISNNLTHPRTFKALNTLYLIAKRTQCPLDNITLDVIRELKAQLREKKLSDFTVNDYVTHIKTYLIHLDKKKYADLLDSRELKFIDGYKTKAKLTTDDLCNEQDLRNILTACKNTYESVLAYLLIESACRISELMNIRIKDLKFDENGCDAEITKSKTATGVRTIRLVQSRQILQKWLEEHPQRTDRTALVLLSPKGRVYSYAAVKKIWKAVIKRAGIDASKLTNFHAYRALRYTALESSGKLSQMEINMHMGWSAQGGARQAQRYSRHSYNNLKQKMNELNGIIKPKEIERKNQFENKVCLSCFSVYDTIAMFCKKCNIPLDESLKKKKELFEKSELIEYAAGKEKLKQYIFEIMEEYFKEKGVIAD
ncbi:MAG: site-specific integrase [Candidatus Diapherotrites archaeon]|nr:site-specific integrase [Candidatus Diapherotrites archaeon]